MTDTYWGWRNDVGERLEADSKDGIASAIGDDLGETLRDHGLEMVTGPQGELYTVSVEHTVKLHPVQEGQAMKQPMTIGDLVATLLTQPQDGTFLCRGAVGVCANTSTLYTFDRDGKGLLEIESDDKADGVRPYSG